MFASKLAKDINAALVIDDAHWGLDTRGVHGSYVLLRRLFNLYRFLSLNELGGLHLPLNETRVANRSEFYSKLSTFTTECNFQVVVSAATDDFCEGHYCFYRWPGVFSEMRQYFTLHQHVDWAPKLKYNYYQLVSNTSKIVAWHLRTSDFHLHAGDVVFFQNVIALLHNASDCSQMSFQLFFLTGDKGMNDEVTRKPPHGFDFLPNLVPDALFITSAHAEVDLYHMLAADVLVGSGSSFAHAAATVANDRLIYIEVPPKENMTIGSGPWQTYHLPHAIVVDQAGIMLNSNVSLCHIVMDQPSRL